MKTSTKIFAGLSSALILGGVGTATYFGIENNRLKDEHEKYVQESTLRDEESQGKIKDLEDANKILEDSYTNASEELANERASNNTMRDELEYFKSNLFSFTCDTVNKTASVKGAFLYSKSLTIPSKITYEGEEYTVNKIENNAFYGFSVLESIVIPNSIVEIGQSAFCRCASLKHVTIPEGVKTLDMYTFSSCTSLETVSLPTSLTSIGAYCFNDSGLIQVVIPQNVTSMDHYCFSGCRKLVSVQLSSNLEELSSGTFSNCSALATVTIPAKVNKIGNNCFNECSSLATLIFENTTGWTCQDKTFTSEELNDAEANAKLVQTYPYYYDWTRTDTSAEA